MLHRIATGPTTRPTGLVDLLMECHARIRHFSSLAVRIGQQGEAPDDEIVEACSRVERYFVEALPLHVADEEQSILPRLRGGDADVDEALASMSRQHADHQPKIDELLRALARMREQPADEQRREDLGRIAKALETDLAEHLALEEAHVLPAISRLLSPRTQETIVEELRARRAAPSRRDP